MTAVMLVRDVVSERLTIPDLNNILRVCEERDLAGWLEDDFNLGNMCRWKVIMPLKS